MSTISEGLSGLFHPPAITIVGASSRSEITAHLVHNLRRKPECRFPGPLNLVNRNPGMIDGIATVSSLDAVEGALGLVVLLVPPPACAAMLGDLAELQPTGVIMYAGGKEIGHADVEWEFAEWSRRTGIPALGPQSSGLAVPSRGVLPIIAPLVEPTYDGPVGVISQSAGLLGGALKGLLHRGLGFHVGVSCGNSAAVGYQDLGRALLADDAIRVLCMYLDGVPDISEFAATLRTWSEADRPVVLAVGGVTEAGRVAARSHTGTLSTPRRVLVGVADQCGAILVDTVEELVLAAEALVKVGCRRPPAPGAIIFTSSGGGGVALADAFSSAGVELPAPSADTAADLAKILSANAGITYNPFDAGGVSLDDAEQFARCLRLLAEDPSFGIVVESMAAGLPVGGGIDDAHVRHATDFVRLVTAAGKQAVLCAPYLVPVPDRVSWPGVITTLGARAGATAVRALQTWARRPAGLTADWAPDIQVPPPAPGAEILVGSAARDALVGVPLRWPNQVDLAEADPLDLAAGLRFPVVAKTESGLAHRARAGGVLVGIAHADQLESAVGYLRTRFGGPVSVAEQYEHTDEYLVGYARHDDGRLLMFGRGGSEVEAQAAVRVRLTPLDPDSVAELLAYFEVESDALVATLLGLQQFAASTPWVQSIDLNPVILDGEDVVALDAKIFARAS